jgi:hypothetical protein
MTARREDEKKLKITPKSQEIRTGRDAKFCVSTSLAVSPLVIFFSRMLTGGGFWPFFLFENLV